MPASNRLKARDARQHDGGLSKLFGDIANQTSRAAGRALTFMIAAGVIPKASR